MTGSNDSGSKGSQDSHENSQSLQPLKPNAHLSEAESKTIVDPPGSNFTEAERHDIFLPDVASKGFVSESVDTDQRPRTSLGHSQFSTSSVYEGNESKDVLMEPHDCLVPSDPSRMEEYTVSFRAGPKKPTGAQIEATSSILTHESEGRQALLDARFPLYPSVSSYMELRDARRLPRTPSEDDTSTEDFTSCPSAGCSATFSGNWQRSHLKRHLRLRHSDSVARYECKFPHCWRVFLRRDALLKHYRKIHLHLEAESVVQAMTASGDGGTDIQECNTQKPSQDVHMTIHAGSAPDLDATWSEVGHLARNDIERNSADTTIDRELSNQSLREEQSPRTPGFVNPSDQEYRSKGDGEDDGRSVQSVKTCGTLVSTLSGATAVDQSATIELERLFLDDPCLIKLYRYALEDPTIGPERLQRNTSRLLQNLGRDLRQESSSHMERLASQLVLIKAPYIARCVIEKFHDKLIEQDPHELDTEPVGADTGDVDELAPIDEDHFEDLPMLRAFLVNSAAFQTFRKDLTKFATPKKLRLETPKVDNFTEERVIVEAPISGYRKLLSSVAFTWRAFLVAVKCLEPPLEPGMTRIRWQCECGEFLFGDVQEYREGSISRLVNQMQQCSTGKVTATPYREGVTNEQHIPGQIARVWKDAKSLADGFSHVFDRKVESPRDDDPEACTTSESVNVEIPPARDLLLLACMHDDQDRQKLHQDSIGNIDNDRGLFFFIQDRIASVRGLSWPTVSLKILTGVHFTKFHLRSDNDVEPRLHKSCCRQNVCHCIPVKDNAEYDCLPGGPLDFAPPVMPAKMLHFLMHPTLIAEREKSVLNQLPKRNCGELEADGQTPAEGWGLYYEEDWNYRLIINVFVATTVFASLVFGIGWSLKRADMQGAWGVSSYMVTTCALVVALLSMVGHSKNE